jgi:hypothetical protein
MTFGFFLLGLLSGLGVAALALLAVSGVWVVPAAILYGLFREAVGLDDPPRGPNS